MMIGKAITMAAEDIFIHSRRCRRQRNLRRRSGASKIYRSTLLVTIVCDPIKSSTSASFISITPPPLVALQPQDACLGLYFNR